MTQNPYQPPSAELVDTATAGSVLRELEDQSTWRLFGLAIITLGVYPAFYVRRQTLRLNRHLAGTEQLPMALPNLVIAFNLLGLALLVPYMLVEEGHVVESVSDLVDFLASISFVVWGFAARSRLNRLLAAQPGQAQWSHGLWTFLFSPFYFNYKVNCLLHEPSTPAPAA